MADQKLRELWRRLKAGEPVNDELIRELIRTGGDQGMKVGALHLARSTSDRRPLCGQIRKPRHTSSVHAPHRNHGAPAAGTLLGETCLVTDDRDLITLAAFLACAKCDKLDGVSLRRGNGG